LELNHARREVRGDGELLPLTTMEYRLLLLLLRRPRRVLSRNDIMDELKGLDWTSSDRSIDVLVAKLRRKITLPSGPAPIRTVRGAGYIFSADVQRL
jgi:DNA-binding response OmpR family regulator